MTMASERKLVARLRARKLPVMAAAGLHTYQVNEKPDELCEQAATAIETLLADKATLQEALAKARDFVVIQGPAAAFPDVLAIIDYALRSADHAG